MWSEIIEKLDEAEQHQEALDVGRDSFDDADDEPLRPDRVHRRGRRVLTRPTPKEIMTPPTPDDTARTWRDLADQLTPEQIAILEDHERHRRDYGTPWSDSEQVDIARRYARQNITDEVLFGHIAPPADETRTNGWWRDRHEVVGPGAGVIDAECAQGDLQSGAAAAAGLTGEDGAVIGEHTRRCAPPGEAVVQAVTTSEPPMVRPAVPATASQQPRHADPETVRKRNPSGMTSRNTTPRTRGPERVDSGPAESGRPSPPPSFGLSPDAEDDTVATVENHAAKAEPYKRSRGDENGDAAIV